MDDGSDDDRWRRLSRFGPFFAVDTVTVETLTVETVAERPDDWAPVTALAEPSVMAARVDAVATGLAAMAPDPDRQVPLRVAASVAQLGLSARLTAVALAATVDGLPVPRADELVYADRLGGAFPLAVLTAPKVSSTWPDAVLALVEPVVDVVVSRYHLHHRIAWGNVASGLAGAAQMIMRADRTLSGTVQRLVEEALDLTPLQGALSQVDESDRVDWIGRRTTCCLIYQLAGSDRSAVCGDCVLR